MQRLSPNATTNDPGQLDGSLVQTARQWETLHGVAKGKVDTRVAEGERASGAIISEGAGPAEEPTRRAGHLEQHPESNRQPGAHLASVHLYLRHLPNGVLGQQAGATVQFVPERGIESG